MKYISSKENQLIKNFKLLSVKKYREQFGLFIIEGEKVVLELIKNFSSSIEYLLIKEGHEGKYINLTAGLDVYIVQEKLFNSLSSTVTSQSVIAVCKQKHSNIKDIKVSNLLVLDRIQDPGNLGTIIRSASASGFNDILLIDSVDVYNEKTVRSASGTIMLNHYYKLSTAEFITFAKANNYSIIMADMEGDNIFDKDLILPEKYALVIGNEGQGVSEEIEKNKNKTISIPMQKGVESLNAGVSAIIIMFSFKNKNN